MSIPSLASIKHDVLHLGLRFPISPFTLLDSQTAKPHPYLFDFSFNSLILLEGEYYVQTLIISASFLKE